MKLELAELQESDENTQRLRAIAKLKKCWENVYRVLYYQKLPFISKIIQTKLISWHHNNSLADHFGIDKTRELINRKYY